LTGDALPRGTYFWQAVHGRLTSGIHASRLFILREASQANQSSTHSSTAVFLTCVVQKQNQKLRKSNSSEPWSECLFLAFAVAVAVAVALALDLSPLSEEMT